MFGRPIGVAAIAETYLQAFVSPVHHRECQATKRAHLAAQGHPLIIGGEHGMGFDAVEQSNGLLLTARQGQGTGMHQCERMPCLHQFGRQAVEPAIEQPETALEKHPLRMLFQELERTRKITRGQCVIDGRHGPPLGEKPFAGSHMQLPRLPGLAPRELVAQEIGEQRVVAIAAAIIVDRRQEHIGAIERVEHQLAVVPASHRIAQVGIEFAQHRRRQKELPCRRRQSGHDRFQQVVSHRGIAAREGQRKGTRIRVARQTDGGQLQGHHPPFRAFVELRECPLRQRGLAPVRQQFPGLLRREPQTRRTDLDHPTRSAPAPHIQSRVLTRPQHDAAARRKVFHGLPEEVKHDRVAQAFKIVEEDCKRLGRGCQPRRHVEPRTRCRTPARSCTTECAAAVERGVYLDEKAFHVVVGIVEQDPHGGDTAGPELLKIAHHGRGLAEAGRCTEEYEIGALRRLQFRVDLRSLDQFRGQDRRCQTQREGRRRPAGCCVLEHQEGGWSAVVSPDIIAPHAAKRCAKRRTQHWTRCCQQGQRSKPGMPKTAKSTNATVLLSGHGHDAA